MNLLAHCPVGAVPDSEPGSGDEDSQETVDASADAAEDTALKLRKRAGLPELEADGLPSTVAPKYLNLVSRNKPPRNIGKFTR